MENLIAEKKEKHIISFNQYLNRLINNFDIDYLFVSFRTKLYTTNINPKNIYETPNGVYTYPLRSFKKHIKPDITEEEFRSIFPFMNDARYMVFFYLEKRDGVLDKKTPNDVINSYVQKIKNKYGSNFTINRLCDRFLENKYESGYGGYSSPTNKLWLFLYDVVEQLTNKTTVKFATLCNELGIDGFADYYGDGYIHINEPKQAVFFKFKSIGKIYVYDGNQNKVSVDNAFKKSNNPEKVINNLKKIYIQFPHRFSSRQISRLLESIKNDDDFLIRIINNLKTHTYDKELFDELINASDDTYGVFNILLKKFPIETINNLSYHSDLYDKTDYKPILKNLYSIVLTGKYGDRIVKTVSDGILNNISFEKLYDVVEFLIDEIEIDPEVFPIEDILNKTFNNDPYPILNLITKKYDIFSNKDVLFIIIYFLSKKEVSGDNYNENVGIIENILTRNKSEEIVQYVINEIISNFNESPEYLVVVKKLTNVQISRFIGDRNLYLLMINNRSNIFKFYKYFGGDFIKTIEPQTIDMIVNVTLADKRNDKSILKPILKYRVKDISDTIIENMIVKAKDGQNIISFFKKYRPELDYSYFD